MERKKALILGGTNPHKELISSLKKRGYYTVLVDYFDNPPAAKVADMHISESAYDKNVIEKILNEQKPNLLISICLDPPIPIITQLAEQYRLPKLYSSETARFVTDKAEMQCKLRACGVTVPGTVEITHHSELKKSGMEFPLVIKPVDSTGSAGISIVNHADEVEEALLLAKKVSPGGRVIAEQFTEGLELSVDCFVSDGVGKVLMIRERHKTWLDSGRSVQCHGTVTPAQLSEFSKNEITETAQRISEGFKLIQTPLLIQGIVRPDGRFAVFEIAARLGGGPGSFRTVQLKTGFNILEATLDSFLGKKPSPEIRDNNCHYAVNNVYAAGGVLDQITGYEVLVQNGTIEEFFNYRSTGDSLNSKITARNRVASFIVKGETRQQVQQKIEEVMQTIEVTDSNGNSIICRHIGMHKTLGEHVSDAVGAK